MICFLNFETAQLTMLMELPLPGYISTTENITLKEIIKTVVMAFKPIHLKQVLSVCLSVCLFVD